jgi:hypothetical protein
MHPSVGRAKDLENMLQDVYAALAASQLAAVRLLKLTAEGEDDSDMSVPLKRLGASRSPIPPLPSASSVAQQRKLLDMTYSGCGSADFVDDEKRACCLAISECIRSFTAADLCKSHEHQGYVQDTLHGTD